jgi:iron complex outermembrane receptor protein
MEMEFARARAGAGLSWLWVAGACACVCGAASAQVATLPPVTVTGTRERAPLSETPAAVGAISGESVAQDRPNHPSQIMGQIPGVAVAVTNGEGHTTAIRHPFTTNPVYLFLEDGIPVRSTGFFNHNALYEINLPQAGGVEVIRGPGTALYGSDAIGGVINVLTRTPPKQGEFTVGGDIGGHGWARMLLSGGNTIGDNAWRADVSVTHTDGWRDATKYDRQSATLRWDRAIGDNAMLKTVLSYSNIDQQTGANSPLTLADYSNNPTRNYLPIAYRKVEAFRLSTSYERQWGDTLLSVTPYMRDNRMELLASFTLNFDPTVSLSENRSYGVLAKWRRDFPSFMRARLIVGADVDVSPGGRTEDSLNVSVTGAAPARVFNSYTFARRVYDYDVTFKGVSPYLHGEISPTERLRVTGGLRFDHLSYAFDNRLAGAPLLVPAGVTFPGARFYGQANSTDVTFRHVSPKLGATFALAKEMHAFAGYTHGFRAPSEGNLFRPASGATAAAAVASAATSVALKPIKADQLEVGLRGSAGAVSYDLVLYDLAKRDDIVSQRDPVTTFTTTVNAGKTRHRGVELGAGLPIAGAWRVDAALSYAKHTYEDWVTNLGNFSGREIEAAPRVMTTTRLSWQPQKNARAQVEWVKLGSYWLDAANTQKYGGHDLFNLRVNWPLGKDISVNSHLNNVANRRYADSAQLSSGVPVLSPGLPRTLYVGMEAKW